MKSTIAVIIVLALAGCLQSSNNQDAETSQDDANTLTSPTSMEKSSGPDRAIIDGCDVRLLDYQFIVGTEPTTPPANWSARPYGSKVLYTLYNCERIEIKTIPSTILNNQQILMESHTNFEAQEPCISHFDSAEVISRVWFSHPDMLDLRWFIDAPRGTMDFASIDEWPDEVASSWKVETSGGSLRVDAIHPSFAPNTERSTRALVLPHEAGISIWTLNSTAEPFYLGSSVANVELDGDFLVADSLQKPVAMHQAWSNWSASFVEQRYKDHLCVEEE